MVATLMGWASMLGSEERINPLDATPENLLLSLLRMGVYVWAAVAAFHYHAKLRRRLALGLADPLIANQIWLWGVSGALTAISSLVLIFTSFGLGINGVEWAPPALLVSFCGAASGLALWCAFFPPRMAARASESERRSRGRNRIGLRPRFTE